MTMKIQIKTMKIMKNQMSEIQYIYGGGVGEIEALYNEAAP